MEHKRNIVRALPYLAALIVFLIVTLFCFAPQFEGKVLSQHDILQYDGMTEDILQHREAFGEDPQWEGNMFSWDACLPDQYEVRRCGGENPL